MKNFIDGFYNVLALIGSVAMVTAIMFQLRRFSNMDIISGMIWVAIVFCFFALFAGSIIAILNFFIEPPKR
jgi:hypothetical protein